MRKGQKGQNGEINRDKEEGGNLFTTKDINILTVGDENTFIALLFSRAPCSRGPRQVAELAFFTVNMLRCKSYVLNVLILLIQQL